jgi:hypothetical protein
MQGLADLLREITTLSVCIALFAAMPPAVFHCTDLSSARGDLELLRAQF